MTKETSILEFYSNEQDLENKASVLLSYIQEYRICGLVGDLGAGKTSLVKALSHTLHCTEVSSPTFSLVHEYTCQPNTFGIEKVIHMDLYRLNTMEEALEIGIEEYLYGNNVVLIEWPGIVEPLLEKETTITIEIIIVDPHTRKYILRK